MKKAISAILLMAVWGCMALSAQVKRPKLVVGIVVDQMRWDYLYYYQDHFCENGFKRMLREGFSCQNALINYVPTVTAIGHSSIFTGTTPAVHGIAGNNFMVDGHSATSVTDGSVTGVGSKGKAGQCSPHNLLTTTIGDELRAATSFQSKVVGIALKDRAAILPAGHSANAAYWYDSKLPGFITSTYYMQQLPAWVSQFNASLKTDPMAKNATTHHSGIATTFDMAKAAIANERLGQGSATDMLTVSISTTDVVAHIHGTHSAFTDSCYYTLDRQLASFLNVLDQKVGKGEYLVFLTADHGGTNNFKYNHSHKLPTGGWSYWKDENTTYNKALKAKFGIDSLVADVMEYSLYVNGDRVKRHGLCRDSVVQAIKDYFERDPDVERLVDIENLANEPIPAELKERIVKGYYRHRSGEIFIMLKPGRYCGEEDSDGSNHGTWSMDDSHIPCVFMGWGVRHGETMQPTSITDIAPTVCSMLHIQMPSGCLGKPIPALAP